MKALRVRLHHVHISLFSAPGLSLALFMITLLYTCSIIYYYMCIAKTDGSYASYCISIVPSGMSGDGKIGAKQRWHWHWLPPLGTHMYKLHKYTCHMWVRVDILGECWTLWTINWTVHLVIQLA